MYKYEYVTVSAEMEGYLAKFNNVLSLADYRKIIDEKAAEGWRYVDHIPVHQYAHGQYGAIDLVFERDVEE